MTNFKMSTEWWEAMKKDIQNSKIWDQVIVKEVTHKKELIDFIEELFNCIICPTLMRLKLLMTSPRILSSSL